MIFNESMIWSSLLFMKHKHFSWAPCLILDTC